MNILCVEFNGTHFRMERESTVVPTEGSFQLFIPLPEIGNCDILVVFCEMYTVIVLFDLCCSVKC